MSKKMYEESYINESALVIQKKLGMRDKFKLENFPELIDKIGEPPSKDFDFYDWDGTRLYSYTKEELDALTALPDLPDHSDINLVSQSWNWTLEDLKTYPFADVGLFVRHTDGFTHLFVNTLGDNAQPYIHLKVTGDSAVIVWGDDTSDTTVSASNSDQSIQHTYAELGDYEIIIKPSSNSTVIILGNTGGNYIFYGDHNSTTYYRLGLKKAYIGKQCSITRNAFDSCYNMECIGISDTVTFDKCVKTFYKCYLLKGITKPNMPQLSKDDDNIFSECKNLKYIATSPNAINHYDAYAYVQNTTLKRFFYGYAPIEQTYRASADTGTFSLEKVLFPENIDVVPLTNGSNNSYSIKELWFLNQHRIPTFDASYLLQKYINKIYLPQSIASWFLEAYPNYDGEVIGVNRPWESNTEFLFDPSTVTDGYKLDTSTGELVSASGKSVSDFIEVNKTDTLYLLTTKQYEAYTDNVIYYDANKDFLSYPGSSGMFHYGKTSEKFEEFGAFKVTMSDLPNDIKYMRFSASTSVIRQWSVWKVTN